MLTVNNLANDGQNYKGIFLILEIEVRRVK